MYKDAVNAKNVCIHTHHLDQLWSCVNFLQAELRAATFGRINPDSTGTPGRLCLCWRGSRFCSCDYIDGSCFWRASCIFGRNKCHRDDPRLRRHSRGEYSGSFSGNTPDIGNIFRQLNNSFKYVAKRSIGHFACCCHANCNLLFIPFVHQSGRFRRYHGSGLQSLRPPNHYKFYLLSWLAHGKWKFRDIEFDRRGLGSRSDYVHCDRQSRTRRLCDHLGIYQQWPGSTGTQRVQLSRLSRSKCSSSLQQHTLCHKLSRTFQCDGRPGDSSLPKRH